MNPGTETPDAPMLDDSSALIAAPSASDAQDTAAEASNAQRGGSTRAVAQNEAREPIAKPAKHGQAASPNRNSLAQGIIFALVGASLWGFSGSCAQFLFARYDIDSMFITAVRMLGSGLLFLVLLQVTRPQEMRAALHDRPTLRGLALFGIVGLFPSQITYVISVSYTNAGTATVLQALNIVFVMFATCVMLRRGPRLLELAGFAMAMAATVLIATHGDLSTLAIPLPGLVWGLVNALVVAFYLMYPKKLYERWSSLTVIGLGMLFGGVGAWLIWGISAASHIASKGAVPLIATFPTLGAAGWAVLGVIVVVGTLVAFGLYLHGVSIVGGMRGSLLGAIEPVSATVISALWLGTMFTWADWAGLFLMVATIFAVTLQKDE